MRALRDSLALALACVLVSGSARAETVDAPFIPSFEPKRIRPAARLPLVDLFEVFDTRRPEPDQIIENPGFRIVGNRSLSEAEVSGVVAPFRGRRLGFSDLELLRDQLSLAYVERGFVASTVSIPDQVVSRNGGTIELRVREGAIGRIAVRNEGGRLSNAYISERVAPPADEPVNVFDLERRVRLLNANERIRRVDVDLVPSDTSGTVDLMVAVEERDPLAFVLELNNASTPLIGGEGGQIGLRHVNLFGRGHVVEAVYSRAQGLDSGFVRYELPIHASGTSLDLAVSSGESEITDDELEALDISSRSATYAVTVSHPLLQSPTRALELSLGAEHRRTKSFLLGEGFGFEDGLVKVSVARLGQRLELRGSRYTLRAQSTFSLGLDALRSTQRGGREADSRFFAWRGQVKVAHQLRTLRSILLVRADVQLTDGSLPGIERIGVGGRETVRGYREKALVRDNAAIAAVEVRIPVFLARERTVELIPHVDVGYAWNESRENEDRRLLSAGVSARVELGNRVDALVGYAKDLRRIDRVGERDLQDSGVFFRVQARY